MKVSNCLIKRIHVARNKINHKEMGSLTLIIFSLYAAPAYAEQSKVNLGAVKDNVQRLFTPKSSDEFRKIQLNELSNFEYSPNQIQSLPIISSQSVGNIPVNRPMNASGLSLDEAVQLAVSRHPDISQSVSSLASQNANIDVARAGYYPQLNAGLSTGDMTSGERGRQLFNLNATQMLFDFGKVKSGINTQEAKLMASQAQLLVSIDDIALQVASSIVNI